MGTFEAKTNVGTLKMEVIGIDMHMAGAIHYTIGKTRLSSY